MSTSVIPNQISVNDRLIIENAKNDIENIGFLMSGLNTFGNVIDNGIQKIPKKQQKWIQELAHKTLLMVVKANLKTMHKNKPFKVSSNKTYKALVTSSGVLGGAFGAPAFAADLTISTKLMMRSILDIARSEGEDLNSYDTQLACLQVFALGGKSKHDDHLETSYYATRLAMQSAIKGATAYMANHGTHKFVENLLKSSASPLMKFIGAIASRFSIQVSEKFIAQAIPVAGAIGGGSINFVFLQHFQKMAKSHFAIRRLERKYSAEQVKIAYEGTGL